MAHGIHHVTLITRKVQANVDFYAGFLGLRLVKRTAGFEDVNQLHLFYGDRTGSPGTLITFLVWEDGSPGRVGLGQVSEIALGIPRASIGFWLTRALGAGVSVDGPVEEFGEPVLRLKDPDGIIVKLVGSSGMGAPEPWPAADIPSRNEAGRLRAITILAEDADLTAGFLTGHFGYRKQETSGATTRFVSPSGDAIDLREAAGFWTSAPGTGTIDHVALRARDREEVEQAASELGTSNASTINAHDRKYFSSLYVREPGGVLIELATDGPGLAIDETTEDLGSKLFIPPGQSEAEDDLIVRLPQFGLPGEPRTIYRELPFVHRIHEASDPDGSTLVLLHGSGGNETSLLSFARRAAPASTLLSLRGRSTEEGSPRWFRRLREGFDQSDIHAEAETFAAFLERATSSYGLDPEHTIVAGHSNGANFLAAVLLLHPGLIRRGALFRPVSVLDHAPLADLSQTELLLVTGAHDDFLEAGKKLEGTLRALGAKIHAPTLPAGHDLVPGDATAFAAWRAANGF